VVFIVSQSNEHGVPQMMAPAHSRNSICATACGLSHTASFIFSAVIPSPHRLAGLFVCERGLFTFPQNKGRFC
jgi:hypothetical protein